MTPTGSLSPDVRAGDSPVETTQDEPPSGAADDTPYDDAHWPDHLLDTVLGEQCAQLDDRRRARRPWCGSATDRPRRRPRWTSRPAGCSGAVDAGRGAYVLSGDWADDDDGSPGT